MYERLCTLKLYLNEIQKWLILPVWEHFDIVIMEHCSERARDVVSYFSGHLQTVNIILIFGHNRVICHEISC